MFMEFMTSMKRFSVALMVLWLALENCPAQTGNAATSGGPISGSDQQAQAADLLGKRGQQQVDLFTGSFGHPHHLRSRAEWFGTESRLGIFFGGRQ
jgi:hypothetical protein